MRNENKNIGLEVGSVLGLGVWNRNRNKGKLQKADDGVCVTSLRNQIK